MNAPASSSDRYDSVYCATCETKVKARLTTLSETHELPDDPNKPMLVCDKCGGCVGVSVGNIRFCIGSPIGHLGDRDTREAMKDVDHLRKLMMEEMPERWLGHVRHNLRIHHRLPVFRGNTILSLDHAGEILEFMNHHYGKFLSIQEKV